MKNSLDPGGTTGRSTAPRALAPARLARPARRPRAAAAGRRRRPGGGRGRRSSVLIWSRESGPRRYDSVQRVWNTVGAASWTLCIRKTRFVERRQHAVGLGAIERRRCRPFEAVEHARLVALGLQPAEEPGAGVGEPLVVEVDRVLRRQHDAEAERAPLLEQRQQRRLRRRIRDRREVAEDLVHVDDRAQARRAGLPRASSHRSRSAAATRRTSARRRRGGRSRRSRRAACPSGV